MNMNNRFLNVKIASKSADFDEETIYSNCTKGLWKNCF